METHFPLYCRDLVHTTENLRDAKLTVEKPVKESQTVDDLLEQYKTENAQLVRESNELHIELLKLREDKDRVTRGRQPSPCHFPDKVMTHSLLLFQI